MSQGVTSQLTIDQLHALRIDNCDYEDDGSIAKARLYKNAVKALLGYAMRSSEHTGERVEVEPAVLERELASVVRWLAVHAGSLAAPLPVFQPAPCWRDE